MINEYVLCPTGAGTYLGADVLQVDKQVFSQTHEYLINKIRIESKLIP